MKVRVFLNVYKSKGIARHASYYYGNIAMFLPMKIFMSTSGYAIFISTKYKRFSFHFF